jgi:hypothetical protein
MLNVITARLSDWQSLALLLTIEGSMFSFARLMQQARRNADKLKTSLGVFSVPLLAGSGYYFYLCSNDK